MLARVIEVASGQLFEQFLQTRLFKPLGMVDTGFYVPEAKLSRLVDPPAISGPPDSVTADVTRPTRLFSGGGGLVSTASDYLRFCQMLLNGGELDGVRILSPATVRRMTTNSLPSDIRFAGSNSGVVGPRGGSTWGLGFAIRSNAAWSLMPGSVGSFTWLGAGGTYFWIDPAEQLVAVQLIQVTPGASGPFINKVSQSHLWSLPRSRPACGGIKRNTRDDRGSRARRLRGNLYVLLDELTRQAGA